MKLNPYDRKHNANVNRTQKLIDRLYRIFIAEATRMAASISNFDPSKPFSFDDYPATKKGFEALFDHFRKSLSVAIVDGVLSSWTLANNKNNELSRVVFGDMIGKLPQSEYRKYFSNNNDAAEAFIARRDAGMNLSDRVWNLAGKAKAELEQMCDMGIRNGLPAEVMQRDMQQYLREPNNFFRRYRYKEGVDEAGNPIYGRKWKKRYWDETSQGYRWEDVDINDYHPGRGVYRSSYKNARRLAVTETNMAYRTCDHERWKTMFFVVGVEIECSRTNHTTYDICDLLAGRYPKDFKWSGWHPHCRCHITSILMTDEERIANVQRIVDGQPPTESVNTVSEYPSSFVDWVHDNAEKIQGSGRNPYFVKDNMSIIGNLLGN